MKRLAILLAMLLAAAPAAAQGQDGPVVFADTLLKDAMKALGEAWVKEGNAPPVFVFGETEELGRDIANGAAADIFFSADEATLDKLEARNLLVTGTRFPVFRNSLQLVGKANSGVTMRRAVTLVRGENLLRSIEGGMLPAPIAIADPGTVAGRYVREALDFMEMWPLIEDRVVLVKDHQEALSMVATGEAQWAFVYSKGYSGLEEGQRIMSVSGFPAELSDAIRHPVARLSASRHPKAKAFYDFMFTGKGRFELVTQSIKVTAEFQNHTSSLTEKQKAELGPPPARGSRGSYRSNRVQ